MRSHYQERASVLNYKDATTSRFGHRDLVSDPLIETRFIAFNCYLIQFIKAFLSFLGNNLTSCQKYHKFLLSSIFALLKMDKKLHRYDQFAGQPDWTKGKAARILTWNENEN